MFWQDKVIVITGGSSGLGKELAQAFGKAGGKVVIAALEPEIVDVAVTELQ
ncbi:MAG: SDR family NAD(P)-dependent oxidoreductase, partial [Thermoguttaceae bacterium]|nr:SDR family NAD(P)-dependent oxidoreductase [Thermoguttaceae bacterium]